MLGVVDSAVPWLEERHVVPWHHFNGPYIIGFLGLTQNKTECGSEALDGEGCNLDAAELNGSKLSQPRLVQLPSGLLVASCPWSEVIDLRLNKGARLVEEV